MAVVVRRLDHRNAHDVALYRTLRLRSLSADPSAFGSSYEREVDFDDATWCARLQGFQGLPGAVFVAFEGDDPLGLVGIGHSDEEPKDGYLWGMWVAPEGRRRGIGAALVDAALAWARVQDRGAVVLYVLPGAVDAMQLYPRMGFTVTQVLTDPENACHTATEMRLLLRA